MFYRVISFYWSDESHFMVEVDVGDDAGHFERFTLEFPSASVARDSLAETVVATANVRWGTNLTSVNGAGIIPALPPSDAEGRPVFALPSSSFGVPIVAIRDAPDDAADYMKSWQITVPPETTSLLDIIIADKLVGPMGLCYLIGGHYRVRTDAAESSALHLAIVDRDDVLGLFGTYGLTRTRLTGLTDIVGTINVGDYAWGGTSGRHARVLSVSGGTLAVTWHDGPFTDGEALTFKNAAGVATGATATLGAWDEGDVIEIKRYVEDEWIEGYDTREVKAGGSKQLPTGLYLRIIGYNAHATNSLRVKLGFQFATK